MMAENTRIIQASKITIISLLIAAFIILLSLYSVNLPYQDDNFDILKVLVELKKEKDLPSKLSTLFHPHNEHRTTSSRLIYWLTEAVTGELNFNYLTAVSGVLLFIFLLSLACHNRRSDKGLSLLAILFLFTLHPATASLLLQPTSAYAFLGAIAYGYFALLFLSSTSRKVFLASLGFALLSTFSMRAGQLIWACGALYLLYAMRQGRRTGWNLVIWTAAAAITLAVYYWNFDSTNPVIDSMTAVKRTVGGMVYAYISLLGSGLAFGNLTAACVMGAISVIAVIYILYRSYPAGIELNFLHAFLLFLGTTMAAIAYARSDYLPAELLISSPRYVFVSLVFLCTIFILLADHLKHSRTLYIYSLPIFIACNLAYWKTGLPGLIAMQNTKIEDYNHSRIWSISNPSESAQKVVNEAIELGIFSPEKKGIPKF